MEDVSDEVLVAEILRVLEIDHQYVRWIDAHAQDEIAKIRHCGRRAGRALGYKVRTFVSDPAQRDDGKIGVFVVVIESTPEDRARIAERSQMLIEQAMSRILG